jgi:hypothetical protein
MNRGWAGKPCRYYFFSSRQKVFEAGHIASSASIQERLGRLADESFSISDFELLFHPRNDHR